MADKQSWRISLGLAAMGILGALLGSAFSHLLTVDRERSATLKKHEADAYVAFLSAFDKYRMSEQVRADGRSVEADDLLRQYRLEAGAAVRRIALFGDKQVIEALALWYQRDALRPCEEHMQPELVAWQKMRGAALGRGDEVSAGDLAAVAGRCSLSVKP